MNLKERAIDEYKKERKLIEESNAKDAEIFANKAIHALQDIIGVQRADIITVEKQPGCVSFRVDDILFRVTTSEGYHVVNIVQKCVVCGSDIYTRILDIEDIGKALTEPHFKYDCDQAVEIKKRLEKIKEENVGGKVLDVNERLISALKDFVAENDRMCSSI
jgi:hypothetical protein